MKRKRYTEEQIVYALKQTESGTGVAELCRMMGVSEATFYNWCKKYKGLGVTEVWELRMLREENRKLKQLVADLSVNASRKVRRVAIVARGLHQTPDAPTDIQRRRNAEAIFKSLVPNMMMSRSSGACE